MRGGLENINRLVSQERRHMALSNVESEWLETTPGERFKIQTSSSDTGGAYLMLEFEAAPRIGVPLHTHDNEEEHFIIVEGTAQIAVGDKTQDFPAGTSITVGKGIPHAWCNLTDSPVRFLVIFTPGRIEGMFRAIAAKKVDDVKAFASSYGTRIIGLAMHPGLNNIFTPRPPAD
jgi:quercetin dioxygenase-like cupin family protein